MCADRSSVLAEDFSELPYWWAGWQPHNPAPCELPVKTDVAVIGGGYAGISCALELAGNGIDVTVLEADLPGSGASTLNGGQVTGGVNVGKSMSPRTHDKAGSNATYESMLRDAAEAYRFLEATIAKHAIDCDYKRNGRVTAAWTRRQLEQWRSRIPGLNLHTETDARLLGAEEIQGELATSAYIGGVLIKGAGHLHPAKYYGGLLSAAINAGAKVVGHTPVDTIRRAGSGYRLMSKRGEVRADRVVVATNGYTAHATPWLKRRLVSVTSHQIATDVLPEELRETLIPQNRGVSEASRVTSYYRYSPDGKRFLFGGRARFYPLDRKASAKVLFSQMIRRFPQLRDVKVSYSWSGRVALTLDALPHIGRDVMGCYYAAGCNGSGVTMMGWLGHRLARYLMGEGMIKDDTFGAPLPTSSLYHGRPWFMPVLGTYYQIRDRIDRRA